MDALALRQPRKQNEDLENLLDQLCGLVDCGINPDAPDKVTFRQIMHAIGRRAYGPLLLLLGLFSISPATIVPGMTWFAATLVLLISAQMAMGFPQPWLPKFALEMTVSRAVVVQGVEKLRPWAKRIDALLRPRFEFLASPPFVNLVALICVATALITYPLGLFPALPLAPGIAVVLFGLGMMARDGLLLMLGIGLFAIAVAIGYQLIS